MKPKLVIDNPTPARFPAPSTLGKAGKEAWAKTAPLLAEGGILPPDKEVLLQMYCLAVESAHESAKLLKRQGRSIKTPTGLKPHPLVRAESVALENALRYAGKLGLVGSKPSKPDGFAPSLVD